MGSKLAVTDNGVHNIAKKIFFTDDKLIHRKTKKMFRTQNGVHRMVYSSGAKWAKYSCETIPAHYVEEEPQGTLYSQTASNSIYVYRGYTFSETEGYVGTGGYRTPPSSVSYGDYQVSATQVWRFYDRGTVTTDTFNGYLVRFKEVARCTSVPLTYAAGEEYHGTYEVEDGEYPEEGFFVAGSIKDSYLVLDVDGTYYYYVRGD